jgi:hypothetical protein
MEVTKCLGCGEVFCGAGLCPDCVRLDAVYVSKRAAKARMLRHEQRIDMGVVPHEPKRYQHLAPVLAIVAVAVILSPLACYAAWHIGKLLIAYLCGAQ